MRAAGQHAHRPPAPPDNSAPAVTKLRQPPADVAESPWQPAVTTRSRPSHHKVHASCQRSFLARRRPSSHTAHHAGGYGFRRCAMGADPLRCSTATATASDIRRSSSTRSLFAFIASFYEFWCRYCQIVEIDDDIASNGKPAYRRQGPTRRNTPAGHRPRSSSFDISHHTARYCLAVAHLADRRASRNAAAAILPLSSRTDRTCRIPAARSDPGDTTVIGPSPSPNCAFQKLPTLVLPTRSR